MRYKLVNYYICRIENKNVLVSQNMVNLAVLCLYNKDLGNIQFSLKSNYTPFELICDTKERGRHVVFGPTLY